MRERNLWAPLRALVVLLPLAGCSMFGVYPFLGPETEMAVSPGQISVEEAFDKVSSLMSSLDYDISRMNTINGVAWFNFMRECVPENGQERCVSIANKHSHSNQEILHPDAGLAFTFYKEITANEIVESRFVIKNQNGSVMISVFFADRKKAQWTKAAGFYESPVGFSKTAIDDRTKMILSFERSYGQNCVNIVTTTNSGYVTPNAGSGDAAGP
jgi:hypothetical protein